MKLVPGLARAGAIAIVLAGLMALGLIAAAFVSLRGPGPRAQGGGHETTLSLST